MSRELTPRAAFRRRLILLMGTFLVASLAMAAQMVRLGVSGSGDALAEAERRLYTERWIPTVRGSIYDRQGRILAQNRPSYEVAIRYDVLSGEWARDRATRHARRVHARTWAKLASDDRETIIARFMPLYTWHVGAMEERLIGELGLSREDLADRKARIIARVERTADSVAEYRMNQFRIEQGQSGRRITPEMYAVFEERAEDPIAAQREPHVIGDATDDVAFNLSRLQDTTVRIEPPPTDRGGIALEDYESHVMKVTLLPGLVVRRSEERQYPYDRVRVTLDRTTLPTPLAGEEPLTIDVEGVAAHLIGWMGTRPLETDVDRRRELVESDRALSERALVSTLDRASKIDRGRYFPGDAVPRAGVEWSREHRLRGLRGLRTERLDTSESQTIDPEPGRDVRLTLDINLQARVQALLDPRLGLMQVQLHHAPSPDLLSVPVGEPLYGAAVVLDVDSGDVLAMVTSPGFSREQYAEDPESLFEDPFRPLDNRALEQPYPPGSVLKAITLCGAVTSGHHELGERIPCMGHLYPNNDKVLRCWIYRPHFGYTNHTTTFGHDLDAIDALTASCNIFFYQLGRRMGPERIAQNLRTFGVGRPFDLGVGPEFPGSIGLIKTVTDETGAQVSVYSNDGEGLTDFDATIMGIGQGPIAWTPLHAANAYATLARMGIALPPRVINDGVPRGAEDTGIDRLAIAAALDGLEGVVNNASNGTAHHLTLETGREPIFNAPGVHVWGKSSTAQAPALFAADAARDAQGNRIPLRSGDHAWFTALAGRENDRPRFAISVIVEHGGSGGRVAGPIVNQIIHALLGEGYL